MISSAPAVPLDAPAQRAAGSQPPGPPVRPPVDLTWLKRGLWLYMALWVGEGALRKWILPGLATPLLVVRDPILLLMYAMALQKGIFPRGAFIGWIVGVSLVALLFSVVGSQAPLIVQVYGFRADFLHLPLIFLIPNVFDRDDVLRVGKWALLLALPMSFLVLLQFKSPEGARINVGVGGEGKMLDAGYGHIRASGTFSFTNGLTAFTAIVTAFTVHGLLNAKAYPRLLRLAVLPALSVLVLLSASRGVVGMICVVFSTTILVSFVQPRYLAPTSKIIGVCLLGAVAAGSFAVFQDGLEVFAYRFGNVANVKEGFIDRFFHSFLVPFQMFDQVDFYGVGLGMGTNAGAGLQHEGVRNFLYAEGEMARVMFESGPVLGSAFLLLRAAIVLGLFGRALGTLHRDAHPLAMLILGACAVDMIQGQFGQATTLGYATIACGLSLAANRPGASSVAAAMAVAVPTRGPARLARPLPSVPPAPRSVALPGSGPVTPLKPTAPEVTAAPTSRGRSLYAEQMHREAEERRRDAASAEEPPA